MESEKTEGANHMEQYRFDPYTGPPLPQARPASSRTWLSGVPQNPPTPPAQTVPQPTAEPAPAVAYAPLEELERLQREVAALREELTAAKAPAKETAEKGKGSKA